MENNPPKRLGEILIGVQKISELNLDEAVEKQQVYKRKIGEILIMMGLLNPEELELYLLYQSEISGNELQNIKLDFNICKKISASRFLSKKSGH
jgi:hypothetical protein